MLSPEAIGCTATLRPLGHVIVHPAESAVAMSTYVVAVVSLPPSGTARMFHFPATSPSARGAGAGGGGATAAGGVVVSAAGVSDFAQDATTATAQQSGTRTIVERRMTPS